MLVSCGSRLTRNSGPQKKSSSLFGPRIQPQNRRLSSKPHRSRSIPAQQLSPALLQQPPNRRNPASKTAETLSLLYRPLRPIFKGTPHQAHKTHTSTQASTPSPRPPKIPSPHRNNHPCHSPANNYLLPRHPRPRRRLPNLPPHSHPLRPSLRLASQRHRALGGYRSRPRSRPQQRNLRRRPHFQAQNNMGRKVGLERAVSGV